MKQIIIKILDFTKKEWLLVLSIVVLVGSSIYLKKLPYYTFDDIEILFILFTLFVTIKGIENSRFFLKISNIINDIKRIAFLLVSITFFLSMFVTNDVALIIMVPLTLSLSITKKDIIIILEALAANAGSAFTPFGNPQNLYIYWYYKLYPLEFFKAIFPFSLTFFILLALTSIFIKVNYSHNFRHIEIKLKYTSYIYIAFLFVFILVILRIIPIYLGAIIILFATIFDRKSLKVDYGLLLTFLCFFGASNNLKAIFYNRILNHSGHIFFLSASLSQIMSNVPVTLLLAKFTQNWKSLLWGVNVGGFGTVIGSLANLIAFRLYSSSIRRGKSSSLKFIIKFTVIGIIAFIIGCGLFIISKDIL